MSKKILIIVLAIVLICTFVACSGTTDEEVPFENGESGKSKMDSGGISPSVRPEKILDGTERSGEGESAGEDDQQIPAGQITAAAWDDNEHYDEWKAHFLAASDNDPAGKFTSIDSLWQYDTTRRVKVTVTSGGAPAVGTEVVYYTPDQQVKKAKTDVKGVAYLFPQEETGTVTVENGENDVLLPFTATERDLTAEISAPKEKANVIKVMFVVDVTGSMGDELTYLKTELADVVHRIALQADGVRIDLALLFYRDDGDQEKFAYHDFVTVTESAGLNAQISSISRQYATGGGDTPEAVDEAIVMAAEKNWGEENSTKLIFFVLDAPPHDAEINLTRCKSGIAQAAAKGIRVCPILCSGADDFCEYVVRQGAILTGGTFIFVTDDSGIGLSHHDPQLPDATVEYLNDMLVRLIAGYHTGDFGTPVPVTQQEDPAPESTTEPTE